MMKKSIATLIELPPLSILWYVFHIDGQKTQFTFNVVHKQPWKHRDENF